MLPPSVSACAWLGVGNDTSHRFFVLVAMQGNLAMYHHGIDQAAAFAAQARALMTEYAIPETPDHYEVWYTYVAGAHPDLGRAIDDHKAQGKSIDADISREWRLRFLSDRRALDDVNRVNDGIQEELGKALEVLHTAGGEARHFGAVLKRTAQALGDGSSSQSVAGLVQKLALETREMVEKSASLELRLHSSSGEIEQLRARLKEATEAARTDILTQIANRRAFEEFLHEAMMRHEQSGEEVTLILGDVDHFKKFNDNWGHQMGDQVLRLIARSIAHHVPKGGLTARYGGEEFAVILPRVRMGQAAQIAENIRTFVAAKSIKKKSTGESVGRVTVSFGVAQAFQHDNGSSIIARADEALYEAKRRGRNCVAQSSVGAAVSTA